MDDRQVMQSLRALQPDDIYHLKRSETVQVRLQRLVLRSDLEIGMMHINGPSRQGVHVLTFRSEGNARWLDKM